MSTRRMLLKQLGLGLAGLSSLPLKSFALEAEFLGKYLPNGSPIRLSSNENPYGPSPEAIKAMQAKIVLSNRYNWDLGNALRESLALKNQVSADNILLGAGSTEMLGLILRFAAQKKGNIILPEPSYNYWAEAAPLLGLQNISVPLTKKKEVELSSILKKMNLSTRLIYICNPNNPTGTVCDHAGLTAFIKEASKKALVLVDEAYIEYSGQPSVCHLVKENKNLAVVRTFSKVHGLAGARVGYVIAHAATIEKFSQLQPWPNGSTSAVSLAAALASLKDEAFSNESKLKNEAAKLYTIAELEKIGLPCIPSSSNFLYFSLANYKDDYFNRLKNRQIAGTKFYEEAGKWTRITIGTMEEMQQFIAALV
ncbi:MAG: histidinol-phosphate transaminase [Ferruginibacter sp.]